jgi:hypothetical protein
VLYLLKVDALVAGSVFAAAGMLILLLFVWEQAKALVTTRHLFASQITNSRTISRFKSRNSVA